MEESKLPITDHLEELRWRLVKCAVAVAVGFVASYAFSEQIFSFLVSPLVKVMPEDGKLIYTSLTEAFFTYMKVAFFSGLVFATPIIFYQVWKFVMPGLYKNERRYVVPFVLVATIIFLMGVSFAFFVVFPVGFKFFLAFSGESITALPSMRAYVSLAMKLLFAFGITFELPVVMFFLAKMGIVNPPMLKKNRKYAILIIAIIAAMLTPGPDILSQLLLGIPLYLLYEVSIWITYFVKKKKDEQKKPEEETAA